MAFKNGSAPYQAGRPNSGGPQLKLKFTTTASVVFTRINAGRSVGVSLLDDSCNLVEVGNVTIATNQAIPAATDILEVRYLYVVGQGGSLYQPVCLRVRTDIDTSECTAAQLKYRAEDALEVAAA